MRWVYAGPFLSGFNAAFPSAAFFPFSVPQDITAAFSICFSCCFYFHDTLFECSSE